MICICLVRLCPSGWQCNLEIVLFASQVYWSLHQAARGERRVARGRGEEKRWSSPGGNREQDVPEVLGRSQVQASHWHRAGDQALGHLWENNPGISMSIIVCIRSSFNSFICFNASLCFPQNDIGGLLAYSLKICMSLMQNKKFRNEVLRVLVKLYMNLEKPDFINVCQVIFPESMSSLNCYVF